MTLCGCALLAPALPSSEKRQSTALVGPRLLLSSDRLPKQTRPARACCGDKAESAIRCTRVASKGAPARQIARWCPHAWNERGAGQLHAASDTVGRESGSRGDSRRRLRLVLTGAWLTRSPGLPQSVSLNARAHFKRHDHAMRDLGDCVWAPWQSQRGYDQRMSPLSARRWPPLRSPIETRDDTR